jgi:hypothetical protein
MKKIAVFAYAFNHAKTQNCLLKMIDSGIRPQLAILQPSQTLLPNPDSIGIVPKLAQATCSHETLFEQLRIPYVVAGHDSPECYAALSSHKCTLGVITGARILRKETIGRLPRGIINAHPGLLPVNRGLDNLKKAILWDIDPAVTFHLIDERIDMGKLIFVKKVPLFETDSLHSVFLRHQTVEAEGLPDAIKILDEPSFRPQEIEFARYTKPLADKFDKEIKRKFKRWLSKRL